MNEKLKFYFLGTLPPQDVEEIELQIITDLDFAAQTDAAETELIEDFLENSLTAENIKLFEKNYLNTPQRIERVRFIKSLRQFAKSKQTTLNELTDEKSDFFDSIWTFFSPKKFAFGLGILFLILSFGIVWRVMLPGNSSIDEIAGLNQKDLSNLDELRDTTVISLIPLSLRSGGETKTLEANKISGDIILRLALPLNIPSDTNLEFNLLQDNKVIGKLSKSRIYTNQNGKEVRLLIPATILKNGEYQVELKLTNQSELKINYNFQVR